MSWADLTHKERLSLLKRYQQSGDLEGLAIEYEFRQAATLGRRLRELARQEKYSRRPEIGPAKRMTTEKYWKLFCSFIGRDPARLVKSGKSRSGSRRKIVVLCDLHGDPAPAVIEQMLLAQPDQVLIDGDALNGGAFSPHPNTKRVSLTDEIARVRALLEMLNARGLQVRLCRGNHDDWAERYFVSRVDPEFLPLIQTDLLSMLADRLPHVEVVNNVYSFESSQSEQANVLTNNWIIHHGDAIVGHPGIARKGEIRSVDAFAEWVDKWRRPLGWEDPALIVQAHVHRAGVSYPAGGRQVRVEGGYSGNVAALQYAHQWGAAKYSPPVLGFTYFEQRHVKAAWKTDLGSVRFVLC